MASKCINCGGELKFDIETGKVKCRSCDSLFEPDSFQDNTAAEEYDAKIFICPSCGAEISAGEFDAVDYCMFCGSFVTLESQMAKIRRPDKIIPFSKNVEDCKKKYRRSVRGKIYAPREFRNEEFVEGFKGIYIPFWNYEYEYGPDITVKGEKEKRKGDYIQTQHYNIHGKASGRVDNMAYDASSTFDDNISMNIAPFDKDKLKPFNPSYMFGFYGDTADIEAQLYQADSDEEVFDKVWENFTEDKSVRKGHPVSSRPASFVSDFNITKSSFLAMMPVWLLTWRKKDRVAYSVMNGDTGEMYTEVPVSILRYLIISLICAVPIFGLLNLGVTLSASAMLTLAIGLSILALIIYVVELDNIVRRLMHTDDRGYLETHPDAKADNKDKVSDNLIWDMIQIIILVLKEGKLLSIVFVAFIAFTCTGYVLFGIAAAAVITPIYTVYRLYKNSKILNDKTVWLDVAGAFVAIIASVILLLADPAPDMPYYLASIGCMLAVGAAAVRMVMRYNQLITRPVPQFFNRKGGRE